MFSNFNPETKLIEAIIFVQVENIISCRVATNGRISYLVRWKGFDADDDTWEPEEHLRGCKDLVLRFFKERDVNPTKSVSMHIKITLRLFQGCFT